MRSKYGVIFNVLAVALLGAAGLSGAGSSTVPPSTGQAPVLTGPTTVEVKTTPATASSGDATARKVYDQDMLKKISDSLCVDGFKAYVGDEGKNVCKNWATSPDIAYTCKWEKKGPPAYPATPKGPCNLDYAVHKGNIVITRDLFPDNNPPFTWGDQAQCCFRSAAGQ